MIFDVELKEIKAQKVLSLRETISAYDKENELWEKLYKFLAENNISSNTNSIFMQLLIRIIKYGKPCYKPIFML